MILHATPRSGAEARSDIAESTHPARGSAPDYLNDIEKQLTGRDGQSLLQAEGRQAQKA